MTSKTHYRKVFKSDHLGVADLEDLVEAGKNLIFTIKEVRQQYGVTVAGKKIDANIAYFAEPIKPLVLNATNSKALKILSGGSAFVEDWKGILVQLYIEPGAKLKGEVVGGVRIHPDPPRVQQQSLNEGTKQWDRAIEAFKRDGNLDAVRQHVQVTKQQEQAIREAANVA